MSNSGDNLKLCVADGTVELTGRDQVSRRSISSQDYPARDEEHNDVVQRESDGSQPSDHQADDTKARHDFWSISWTHISTSSRSTKIEILPATRRVIPQKQLKYIDVVRRTNRTCDVLLESRIVNDWNVDGGRDLSAPWTGFTHSSEQKGHQMDTRGPRAAEQKFRQHPDSMMYGQMFDQVCRKQLNK